MSILEQLKTATISALKSKDSKKLKVLRTLNAKIKQHQIDKKVDMDDVACLAVLNKQLKQHQESISIFKTADRIELVQEEEYQVSVLKEFLPKPLEEEEIQLIISNSLSEIEPTMKNMGKIVKLVQDKIAGRANMGSIVSIIKSKLT